MDCLSCRNGTGVCFLPSLTSVIGIRTASGFEIGVGPNLSLAGCRYDFRLWKKL